MIEVERIQEIFECIRLHLTGKYDFFKYNGRLKNKPKVYPSTNYLKKLPDEYHVIHYFISNQIYYFVENGRFCSFSPELVNDSCMEIYKKFMNSLKKVESSLYSDFESIHAKGEMKKLTDIDYVMTSFYSNKLSLFVIVHLFKFTKMKEKWKISDNPLSIEFYSFLSKIEPFLKFKEEIFSEIIKKISNT